MYIITAIQSLVYSREYVNTQSGECVRVRYFYIKHREKKSAYTNITNVRMN